MEKFEKLVNEIMRDAEADGEPLTRAEAEEMAKMELGAKEIKRYEQAETKKERKPKERKVDKEKKNLLDCIRALIEGLGAENVSTKTETEVSFTFNGNPYTIKLTKHRPNKQGIRARGADGSAQNF